MGAADHAEPRRAGRRIHLLVQYPFMFRDTKINYFTSNLPASSFETDRSKFLGENEYGTWRTRSACPAGAELHAGQRGDNIAACCTLWDVCNPARRAA